MPRMGEGPYAGSLVGKPEKSPGKGGGMDGKVDGGHTRKGYLLIERTGKTKFFELLTD